MKPHKRLMASLAAHGVAPGQRTNGLVGAPSRPYQTAILAGHSHRQEQPIRDMRFHPPIILPTTAIFTIFEEAAVPVCYTNRKERRAAERAAKLAAPIPISTWLLTQPGSTRRGYARGRFVLPKNVFVS